MADELISKQAVLDLLRYNPVKPIEGADVVPAVIEVVRRVVANVPAEVVRCGECRYRYDGRKPNCHGRHPDWFCADGIRRRSE